MANGVALHDAVAQLSSLPPGFSVGCHLSLVDGQPTSDPSRVRTLLDGSNEFRRTIGKFAFAASSGKLDAQEIEREASAQFQRLLDSGVQLSHFDAHKHAHMFPQVLEPVLKAAAECGIRKVRNPFEPSEPLPITVLARKSTLLKRYLQVKALATMGRKWTNIVQRFGFATPKGSLGIIATGDLDRDLLRVLLQAMPDGTWELVCHPGYDDNDLTNARTRLRASRERELSLLTSPETKEFLKYEGIELISYHDL